MWGVWDGLGGGWGSWGKFGGATSRQPELCFIFVSAKLTSTSCRLNVFFFNENVVFFNENVD